jgi:hypothetical protein
LLPKRIAGASIKSITGIDRNGSRLRRYHEQHGIAVRMFVKARMMKCGARMFQCIGHAPMRDVNAYASRRTLFGGAYRAANAFAVDTLHGKFT